MVLDLRKIGGNALSILTSDMMNRVSSFVLYALVGRHLGAHEFGQLSLALTLFYIFQVLAAAGLKTLTIRQVAKDRSQTRRYFLNGCLIVTFSSLGSLTVLFTLVRLMHYPAGTTLVILVLSLALFPYAVSAICEGVFQAWERMHYIAYVNVPVNIAKIAGAILLLSKNQGLYAIILVLLFSFFAAAGIEVWILLRRLPAPRASVSIPFSLTTVRSSVTFLGIDGTIAVMSSLNVLLLSKLATEVDVGLYSAASQLMVPLLLIYQSFAQSIFPEMCRKAGPGCRNLKRLAEQAIEVLLVLALPAVAGIFFLGHWALSVLYRNPAFQQSFPALRIMAWTLIFQVFTSVLGQVLVASHREKVTLRIVAVNALINLCVGWPLVSFFGVGGAAIALLLTRLADCWQHFIPVARLFSGIPIAKIIWKPVVAALGMGAYLAVTTNLTAVVRGVSATLVYGAALFAVAVLASGGFRQFKNKYLLLEPE